MKLDSKKEMHALLIVNQLNNAGFYEALEDYASLTDGAADTESTRNQVISAISSAAKCVVQLLLLKDLLSILFFKLALVLSPSHYLHSFFQ